jgi:crotonobetainyl-CoA:carnitine CoA-transferase CaiB-like acyl-CoA transferase
MNYPGLGNLPVPGIPMKLSLTPGSINTPSPKLGEHNEEVYGGLLGFNPEKLFNLKREGII